jgi:predicted O-methyltransferase YrrM
MKDINGYINYVPTLREHPNHIKIWSAWEGIPTIIKDLIVRFNIQTNNALEFGVEFGYSTSALACYFEKVIGVDTFIGDDHSGHKINHFEQTKNNLINHPNIQLVESNYQEFIKNDNRRYDLIHIDIVHTYNETFECGDWSVQHSDVVIFHDTISFPEINKVCHDLSEKYNLEWFNYPESYGLGILVNKNRLNV